ncbi:MAG: GGDEF domain-containing protein [Nitrosomonadales bacterium]|nr:GGDEF domain-containing protein [Nitrosomonadales bacterium]
MNSVPANHALNWEEIWDAVKLGLILIDGEGKVLLWNDWVSNHSGIPAEFALSHSLESLFPDGLSIPFKTAVKNALSHKLPIILSNALHRSPLPIYPLPITQHEQKRMQQSITITPIIVSEEEHLCLIQIADASISVKREGVLKSHSVRLSKEATTDGLTGAYNRRFFDERFAAEFGRAQRQNIPLSLIMLDVDYFKLYNDNYGHPAGDKVLISIVKALKSQLNRPTDVVVRYGGEEFAVILPDSEMEGGRIIAEKLRVAVSGLNIPHSQSKVSNHVTVSIGVAAYQSGSAGDAVGLLKTADAALYDAKHSGRNCVRNFVAPEAAAP